MRTIEPFAKSDEFKDALIKSVGFHVALFFIFAVRSFMFSDADMLESAIRVDFVGLPEKAQTLPDKLEENKSPQEKEEKAPEKSAEKLPEKKKTPESTAVNLNKAKNQQSNALKKLKAQQAIDELKKAKDSEAKAAEVSRIIKGNQVSPGTELTGVTRLQYDKYRGLLERHVKERWSLPEWLRHKELQAVVNVRFDESGKILSLALKKSSGNQRFDEIALETVQESAPLPAPPDKFVQKIKIDGVNFGFPE